MAQVAAPIHGAEPPPSPPRAHGRLGRALWFRELEHYPNTGPRLLYLAIVVVTTIILYYQLYVAGSVAPQILAHYGMSFRFYVDITVVGNAIGAFTSILAGLADRWGRANMVAYGLVITGLLVLIGIPHAPNEWVFAIIISAVGFVEGIILVATPALVRDFSPQLGRASAMGFWTLGPVVGSLVVAEVASHTLAHLTAWQDQFIICGIVGLVVAAVALVGLRELSPGLRDQLMVSIRDRVLIEARAKGIDVRESLRHPWRQMLKVDIVLSALAISLFLIIYYTAVGFNVIYFETIFGFSASQANGLGNWLWAFDAGALIVVGVVADRLRVRKPFMVAGGIGAVVMTIIYLSRATDPHTGYYTIALIFSLMAVCLAVAYGPWMASFTETVERRNPALTATGLAVWGWILRIVVAGSIFVLPYMVSSVTPLVTYGPQVQAISARYAPQIATAQAIDPTTLAALTANPNNLAAAGKAIGEIAAAQHVAAAEATKRLIALGQVPKADFAYLQAHGAAVQQAAKASPSQWQHWYWLCVGAEIVFLPLVLVMAGRWRPKRAKEDAERHEQLVRAELAKLAGTQPEAAAD